MVRGDPALERKTAVVVLEEVGGSSSASVYRQSGRVPGSWSRDAYVWRDGAWHYEQKDPRKYSAAPLAPVGSETFHIGPVRFWTRTKINAEELGRLQALGTVLDQRSSTTE